MNIIVLKKTLVLALLFTFVVGPAFLLNPPKALGLASLYVPTVSPNDLKESGTTIFGVTLPISLDGIAFMAANVVIAQITDSIVSWINSGFQGSPAFVQDPAGWLLETADIATGAFIEELGAENFLCAPFAPIRAAFIYNYSGSFRRDYRCKLSDVINNVENFADFTSGNFSGQGGWDTWFDITQNPANNPYGVYIGAQIELDRRIANAVGLEQNKLDWGKGFLSIQRCTRWDTADGDEPRPPTEGDPFGNPTSGAFEHDCVEYGPIETPGSIVETQLNNALGSELGRIQVADEINEILSALVNQLVKTVFTAGLSSFNEKGKNNVINPDFLDVSCSYQPTSTVYLDPPASPKSQPVNWKASILSGGTGKITYSWTLTGDPTPISPPLVLNTREISPVTYSTAGQKTAKISVTKEVNDRQVTKFATCSLNVLPNPPLEVTSCSVEPSSILRKKETRAIWTLTASGGASIPDATTTDKMGFCIFTGYGDRSPGIGFGYSVPLRGTSAASSCSFEHAGDFFEDLGPHFMTIFVNSGTQSTSEQCGPLNVTNN